MAMRANASLAFKAQTGFGTPASGTFKLLPFATWDPGVDPQRIADDTKRDNRFGAVGRAGRVTVTPRMEVNYRSAAYDEPLAALFQGAWATDTLTQGSTPVYFGWHDWQSDATADLLYQDLTPNTLELRLDENGFIRSVWTFLATLVTPSGTGPTTPSAAVTDAPFDTLNGSLTLDGSAVPVTGMSLTVTNNLAAGYNLFERYPSRVVGGLDSVTGSLTLPYQGVTRLGYVLDNSTHALVLSMTYGTKGQTWTLPAIKLTSWGSPVTTDNERFETINFEADLSSGTKITVLRDNV